MSVSTEVTTAPLTWGQRAIWKAVEAMAPDDHSLNVRRVLTVPAQRRLTPADATTALQRLVAHHAALRTRIRPLDGAADGELHQVLGPPGPLNVQLLDVPAEPDAPTRRLTEVHHVVEAPPGMAEATDELLRRVAMSSFDYPVELPLRAALVTVNGAVRLLVLVLSHVAADHHAAERIVRDLRLLLARGELSAPAGLPAMELARREQADGRRAERALRYWSDAYRRLPAEQFRPVAPAADPPFQEVQLISPALHRASLLLAARHQVSPATVLLAATSVVIGGLTGAGTCGLVTMVHNRFQSGHADIVAPMSQLGLFVLDVPGPDDPAGLHELLPRAWRQALAAYRYAYYDQTGLDRALAASGRGGGGQVDPYCCFNDIRRGGDVPAQTGPVDPDGLRALLAQSRLVPKLLDGFNWHCYIEVRDRPGALGYAVQSDTRYLPPAGLERFALAVERYVVEAALT